MSATPPDRPLDGPPGQRPIRRLTAVASRKMVAASLLAVSIALGGCLPASVRPTPAPTPTPTPPPTAPPTPTPTAGPPTPTPGPTFALYKVRPNDTLTALAKRFSTTLRSIAYWNRDKYPSLDPESADYSPNRLEVGWVLRILPGQEYVPSPSDFETGIDVTPSPDDEYEESPLPGDSASP